MNSEKTNQILLWVIRGGVFAILFLPFVIGSNFFFPFITLKNVLFRMIVEIVFFLYLILAIRDQNYRPKLNFLTLSVFLMFLIITLTTFTGIGLERSFWGNYERMGGLFRWWHLLLFFIILISTFKDRKDWFSFFTFSIFTGFLIAIFGFAQKLEIPFILGSSGGDRLTGTIGNAAYLAAFLMFGLFFLLYFIFKEKYFNLRLFLLSILGADLFLVIYDIFSKITSEADNYVSILRQIGGAKSLVLTILIIHLAVIGAWFFRRNKWAVRTLLILIFGFEFFIFIWAQTRGAVVGFWLGIFVFLLFYILNLKSRQLKKAALASLAVLMLLPVLLLAFKDSVFIKENNLLVRYASITTKDVSTNNRLLVWDASWRGWIEDPIRFLIGYGQENFYYVFNKNFPPDLFQDLGSRIWFDRAHNIVLDTGITTGLIGLLSYLLVFGAAFWFLWSLDRKKSNLIYGLVFALLVGYFVQNCFVFDTLNTLILFFLILAFISFLKERSEAEDNRFVLMVKNIFAKIKIPGLKDWVVLGLVLVLVGYGLFLNVKTLRANNYLYKALKLQLNPNYDADDILEHYDKAINEAIIGRHEAREQLANYALQLLNNSNASNYAKNKAITFAIEEFKKSVEEEPTHVRHYLYLASIINRGSSFKFSNPAESVEIMKKAVSLSPTRPQVYFELGQSYLLAGNIPKGVENFEKGTELSDDVIDSHVDLAVTYILSGNKQLALKEIENIKQKFPDKFNDARYMRLLQSFGRIKDWDAMAELNLELIEKYPEILDYYAQLALIYASAGRNDEAETWAKKVLELDPNYQDDYNEFIRALRAGELKK